ncbi:MAG: hemerythrin domain-containing protein [Chloroflexi bacterium]|nr:hemerythrin domain-containing protein [Chloroflexota bacterium]
MNSKISCPGSRAIKNPTPEYFSCPNCGTEVEIWTNEPSYPCSNCGTRVFRDQNPSCIDWCPYAEECVGPEVYQSLKPENKEPSAERKGTSPIDIVSQEHDKALNKISLLRAATLCLRASTNVAGDQPIQTIERAYNDMAGVFEFVDNELSRHLQREEDVLFPLVEKHIGKDKSPTVLLLAEHDEIRQTHAGLKKELDALQKSDDDNRAVVATELYKTGSHFGKLLNSHIEKENASLLPIAKSLFNEKELEEFGQQWRNGNT